ncbi:oligosaccharide flippase family protein [Bacillus songklensis]|uniref:Oligosaccharide flippase family protein n=1 Tax=Bacillus songklensis TaxID=1069116 RepID=A0ABV8B121_9BACI
MKRQFNKVIFVKHLQDDTSKKLIDGSAIVFLLNVAAIGVSFLTEIVLTRTLGTANYGHFTYAMAWLNLMVLTGRMGFDTAAVRFVAEYQERANGSLLKGFITRSQQISICCSFSLSVIVLFFGYVLMDEATFRTFAMCALIVPFWSLLFIYSAYLQGTKFYALSVFPQQIARPLLIILIVLMINGLFNIKPNSFHAMLSVLLAVVSTLIMVRVFFQNKVHRLFRDIRPRYKTAYWFNVSFQLCLISFFKIALRQIDIIVLGIFANASAVGVYSIAIKISELTTFGMMVTNVIVAPMISQIYARGDKELLQNTVSSTIRIILIATVPLSIVMAICGKWILGLFGADFMIGYTALVILIIGQIVNSACGPVGFLMSMTGHQNQSVTVFGSSILFNLILSLLLIPPFGLIGAAFSTSLTTVFWNLLLSYLTWKKVGIKTSVFK